MNEIECRGLVRGGSNQEGRAFLHIHNDMNQEELAAIMGLWAEEFGFEEDFYSRKGCVHPYNELCFRLTCRKEFAMAPAIIRKALRLGWQVSISLWDVGPKAEVFLSQDAGMFWRELALAQMYYFPSGGPG